MAKNNFVAEVTFNKIIWFSNIYSTAMKTSFRHYDVALQIFDLSIYETLCVIWHYLYNSKNLKNTHGGVILLVKLQASSCNFTKRITLPWVYFTFFKLYK